MATQVNYPKEQWQKRLEGDRDSRTDGAQNEDVLTCLERGSTLPCLSNAAFSLHHLAVVRKPQSSNRQAQ